MLNDKELLQQALDALQEADTRDGYRSYSLEIEAIQVRLAQPDGVQGEVRVQIHTGDGWIRDSQLEAVIATSWVPPAPKKEWVGLTDEEIWHLSQFNCGTRGEFARAIEAKLKEKNSG